MKKLIRTLAVSAIAMAGVFTTQAQTGTDAPAVAQKVQASYVLNTLYPKGADNQYYNGFGVGYNVDFKVAESLPLYVGTGLEARFLFNHDDILTNSEYDLVNVDRNTTFISLNLPVNVSYRVPVADGFYLTPFVGLDFRAQLYGHAKYSVIGLPSGWEDELTELNTGSNLFSKEEYGDNHLNRFQMGWHAGLNFEYQRFILGLQYGTDFVKLHKNLGGSNFLVSLGYAF